MSERNEESRGLGPETQNGGNERNERSDQNVRKDKFEYTYWAPTEEERREIERISGFYRTSGEKEEKLERLKRLNGRVKNTATFCSLGLGILGCLVFGLGMSMILAWNRIFAGIAVAVVGGIPMLLANPVYNLVLRKTKQKYGEEILRISEELLHSEK